MLAWQELAWFPDAQDANLFSLLFVEQKVAWMFICEIVENKLCPTGMCAYMNASIVIPKDEKQIVLAGP